MEFNLDFLKNAGEALFYFGNKNKDDERFDSELQDQNSENETKETIKNIKEKQKQK